MQFVLFSSRMQLELIQPRLLRLNGLTRLVAACLSHQLVGGKLSRLALTNRIGTRPHFPPWFPQNPPPIRPRWCLWVRKEGGKVPFLEPSEPATPAKGVSSHGKRNAPGTCKAQSRPGTVRYTTAITGLICTPFPVLLSDFRALRGTLSAAQFIAHLAEHEALLGRISPRTRRRRGEARDLILWRL